MKKHILFFVFTLLPLYSSLAQVTAKRLQSEAAQESLLVRNYEFVRSSDPWLTQGNAAALTRFSAPNIAEAELSLSRQGGGLVNYDGSPSVLQFDASAEAFYRLSRRTVVFGSIAYDNFSGNDMSGSVFMPSSLNARLSSLRPFDIVEENTDNDFEQEILPAVRTSKVFMLIFTSDALTRCENQGDWVRREITEAHLSGRKIITVNPDYSFNSFPRHLPEELQFLKTVQMSSIDMGPNFEVTVEKMVRDRIQPIVPSSRIADSIPDKPGTIRVGLGNKTFEIPDEFFHIEVYKALKRSYL